MGFSIGIPELVILLILLSGTVFWVWMIADCATKEKDPDRLVWIIIIVVTYIIGAALYFFIRRPERRARVDRLGG
jgi:heme/copper-type cytochrome/quinol oxidase subunit 2